MSGPYVPRSIGRLPQGWPRSFAFLAVYLLVFPFIILVRVIRLGRPMRLTDTAVINLEDGRAIQIPDMSARLVTLQEVFDELAVHPGSDRVFLSSMTRTDHFERIRDFRVLLGPDDIVIVSTKEKADRMP